MSEGAVRTGEELDIARVDAWLKAQVRALLGPPEVTQYSGGASNWTYRLKYPSHDLILRRPPAGTKAKSAHDMGREFRIQSALLPVFAQVPKMIAHCTDEAVIGAEFYVMERLDGIIPRKNFPPEVRLDEAQTRRLCLNMIDTLIALHRVDYRAAGLEHVGKGAGYAKRQIEGWSDRYQKARTWNVPKGTRVMEWLSSNLPSQEHICVTHNDYRFDNLVLDRSDPTKILGVLDWELATLGDPLMDLGNTLTYWVEAKDGFFAQKTRRQPTHLKGMLTRREVVDYYCEKMGLQPENWAFYEVYGLFRLSVIVQQIYYRYHHGQTDNPKFRNFWLIVHYLHHRCRRSINASTKSGRGSH